MKSYIVVNKDIYLKYKDEILPLNPRLFKEPYFYFLNEYEVPFDLKGITSYLNFVEEVEIYACSTFIDFVNILLILSFLKANNYSGKVNIKYVFMQHNNLAKSIFVNTELTSKDYDEVDKVLTLLKLAQPLPSFEFKVIGYLSYVNFYNMIIDQDKFMLSIDEVIEDFEDDIDEIASYLEKKYSNMGLNKEFYKSYLEKYM